MSAVRWEDLEYKNVHSGRQYSQEPNIIRELKIAGVSIASTQVRAESQHEVVDMDAQWGGSHGVEFEVEPPTTRYEMIPALYAYRAPQLLLALERWIGDDNGVNLAAWTAQTFSPGTLGTMYALHEGDWFQYMFDLWHAARLEERT